MVGEVMVGEVMVVGDLEAPSAALVALTWGSLSGAHVGGFGGAMAATARGFHGNHHRYGAYLPRYGNAYGYGGWECSLDGWRYGRQWPNQCYRQHADH
jgi:hypothetical protein